tara:strand:+ start:304 stop:651 length:348 start_codon:yes stop_codon:yes gene_type:complete
MKSKLDGREKLFEKYSQFIMRIIEIAVVSTSGPTKINLNTILKCSNFLLPRYSAKNLVPAVPKKFVTKIVIIRQKLIETFMEPSVSLPNVLAIKKLNANGMIPTNASASPVWSEF